MDALSLESEIMAAAMVLVAFAVILLINRDKLGLHYREWQLQRSIKKMGSDQIRNLICADGLDGYYDLDRILLTSKEIILISYRPYSGNIYCAERISEWTQVLGQQSFKFKNPLFDLENQLTALKQVTGKVPLRGFLLFGQYAHFPKGHPPAVLYPGNIPESFLADNCEPPSAEIQAVWAHLMSIKQEGVNHKGLSLKT